MEWEATSYEGGRKILTACKGGEIEIFGRVLKGGENFWVHRQGGKEDQYFPIFWDHLNSLCSGVLWVFEYFQFLGQKGG